MFSNYDNIYFASFFSHYVSFVLLISDDVTCGRSLDRRFDGRVTMSLGISTSACRQSFKRSRFWRQISRLSVTENNAKRTSRDICNLHRLSRDATGRHCITLKSRRSAIHVRHAYRRARVCKWAGGRGIFKSKTCNYFHVSRSFSEHYTLYIDPSLPPFSARKWFRIAPSSRTETTSIDRN